MSIITLTQNKGEQSEYLTFSNNDGKRWTIPLQQMKMGLEIYEPSGRKGKIIKKALPYIHGGRMLNFMRFGEINAVSVHPSLKRLLCSIYTEYECSIFWGTPCIDRKITMQIFSHKKILGYCKIGNTKRIYHLFLHEKNILEELFTCQVKNVPQCVGVYSLDETTTAFIQTTKKELGAHVEHRYGDKQHQFLTEMYDKTKIKILFERTDFYESIRFLKCNTDLINEKYRKAVIDVVSSTLLKYEEQYVEWGVCHRDFTPWNTCTVDGQLFVFDFEYSHRYAPKGIDRWHFFVQTLYFEKHMDVDEIAFEFLKKYSNEKDIFKLYLVDNISMYLLRGEKHDIEIANQKARILSLI